VPALFQGRGEEGELQRLRDRRAIRGVLRAGAGYKYKSNQIKYQGFRLRWEERWGEQEGSGAEEAVVVIVIKSL